MPRLLQKRKKRNLNSYCSPAKLNLFFRVLRKRSDGYHEIASLFQAIDLFDRLFVSEATSDQITCSDSRILCDDSNLVSKALHCFRKNYPVSPVRIHIEKNIPIEGGLGGGSSNAASVLWALNERAGHPATVEELIEMGATIGSDVPFFFSKGTAYCTGRGEIMTPFSLPEPLMGYVAKPDYGLSTPLVYKEVARIEFSKKDPLKSLVNYPEFFNDLEIPAFRIESRLKRLHEELQIHFKEVRLTGSGSAFFCLHGEPKPIEGVKFYPFQSVQRPDLAWY